MNTLPSFGLPPDRTVELLEAARRAQDIYAWAKVAWEVLQRPHTTYYLPGRDSTHWRNPQLPSPHELPEVRAMRRALIAAQREAQR